ncbi:MAG: hypothetical protein ACTHQM_22125 [Thermoanaerobaculia bacterium]
MEFPSASAAISAFLSARDLHPPASVVNRFEGGLFMAFWDRVREGVNNWSDRDRDRDDYDRDFDRGRWQGRDRDYDRPYDRGYGTDYSRGQGFMSGSNDRGYDRLDRNDYGSGNDRNRDRGYSSNDRYDYDRGGYRGSSDRYNDRFSGGGGSDFERASYGYNSGSNYNRNDNYSRNDNYGGGIYGDRSDRGERNFGAGNYRGNEWRHMGGRSSGGYSGRSGNSDTTDFDNDRERWNSSNDDWDRNRNRW